MTLYLYDIHRIENYWDIPLNQFKNLMESNQLWIKSEFLRYQLAKVFTTKVLQMYGAPDWDKTQEKSAKRRKTEKADEPKKAKKKAFLETPEGEPFVEIFRAIHMFHLTPDELSCLKEDNIVPASWFDEVYQYGYHLFMNTLGVDHKSDKYSCRFGFEFPFSERLLTSSDEDEFSTSDFFFAGSKWKLIIGVGIQCETHWEGRAEGRGVSRD